MKFDVLGLGESLKEFKPSKNKTIGVNDIFKHHSTDYLVCVDKPSRFTKDRLNTILKSDVKKFYTHLNEWSRLKVRTQIIKLNGLRGSLKGIEGDEVCYSNNSTFVAVVLAYKMGATQINIYGADFNTHPNFKNTLLETALEDFQKLFDYLIEQGVKINISKGSKLNDLI
jgi:hypothetical protein